MKDSSESEYPLAGRRSSEYNLETEMAEVSARATSVNPLNPVLFHAVLTGLS